MNALKHISSILGFSLLTFAAAAQTGSKPEQVTVQVKNEEAVNTAGLEFSPTFYEDGIVFISTNNAGLEKITDPSLKLPAMSILRSRRDAEGALGAPEPFAKELSSRYHEGPVCFDRTAETVYFSRNILVKGREKRAKDDEQKMRLYFSKKSGEAWGEPQPLPFNTNEFDDCHPALSFDGDKLYFASNRPGGYGGMDLYVSYRVGDTWSEPANLGAEVNTKGNDLFPFVHADNILYFASNGHGGEGGLDLYFSIPDGAAWTKPKNLGKPFNSGGDDFGLIVDQDKINGYFASNGQSGKGGDDISSFHLENGNLSDYLNQDKVEASNRNLDILVTVMDKNNNAPVAGADVRILDLNAGDVIGRDEDGNLITIQNIDGKDVMRVVRPHEGLSGLADRKGRYGTELNPGHYSVTVAHEGYQTKQVDLDIDKPGNRLTIELEKVAGKVYWNASVFNYLTNSPLSGATALVINKPTGDRDTIVTDDNGRIHYYLEPNTKYQVELYQAGRMIGSTEIDAGKANGVPLTQNLSVAPLLPGTVVELPNIYYNFNDATLRPDARKDLDLVVALMKQHQAISVELASHTDCRGKAEYNQELSQRRANGVVEYLVTQGISRNRLRPVGYGESEPRNECHDGATCTEQEHARNRRTEIRILTSSQGASLVYLDGQIAPNQNTLDPTPTPNINVPPTKSGADMMVNSGDMDYYVVAGSFLMENRAQARLRALLDSGYSAAEVTKFAKSPFFSVCAGKFVSQRDAENLKQKLKKGKIDAFVRAVPRIQ